MRPINLYHPIWKPAATHGYRAFEMWLLWIEMCCEYKIHARFQRLRMKKEWKYLINDFDIDFILKWEYARYRDSLWPMIGQLTVFDFRMARKWYIFNRNCTSHFQSWSFPMLAICSVDRPSWSAAAAPSKPPSQESKRLIHWQPFNTRTPRLFFTFRTVFDNLQEMVSLL